MKSLFHYNTLIAAKNLISKVLMIPNIVEEKKLSVLLVEDNALNQKLMIINLSKLNCIVSIANNGLEGLNLFKAQKFDVILMDLMMPVMDGFESSFEIRKIEKEEKSRGYTPIIAFTANTLNNDFKKCLEYGMDYLMEKPFNAFKFKEIIESFGQHL
ncbi:MAG: response regulator [Prolixibacteraceae bacterium]|jgi:osomolarity two-component system sensor histidine kinase NIK1|nr:response regulator [Prolixibacteraceae bacterium]